MTSSPSDDPGEPLFEEEVLKASRLEALHEYDILDTPPEEAFDRLTRLAADVFGAEVAFVAFLDSDRQWFKSAVGLDRTESSLAASFCTHTIEEGGVTVIEDAAEDERTAGSPFVTEAGLRFYAGVPIRAEGGEAIGTFSIMDAEPRSLSEQEGGRLADFGQMASEELWRRREARRYEQVARRFGAVLEDPNMLAGVLSPDGTLLEANENALQYIAEDEDEVLGQPFWETPWWPDEMRRQVRENVERGAKGEYIEYEADLTDAEGRPYGVEGTIRPVTGEDGAPEALVVSARDVTERRWREEELRRARRQYCAVFEDPNILVGLLSPDGTVIDINQTALTHIERSLEEIEGERFWKTPWFEGDEALQEEVRGWIRGAAAGKYVEFEADLTEAVGKRLVVEGALRPVTDEEGNVTSLLISDRDVTERKLQEEKLRQQKALLEQTQRLAGAWEVDLQAGEMSWSEKVYQIHEIEPSAEVSVGEGIGFYAPEERPKIREAFEHCAEEGKPYDLELPIVTAEGNQRWIRAVGAPVEEKDGDVTKVAGAVQDITQREQVRRRLERYREYTSRMLDAIDDLFFALDETGRFERWNRRCLEVTGYTDEEIGRMSASDLVLEGHRERVETEIEHVLATGDGQVEVPVLRKDGSTVPYEFIGDLVEDPTGNPRVVVVGRDISERLERERELERQNDLFEKAEEIANVGAWEYNRQTETLTLTDQAYRIHGLDPGSDVLPERVHGLYHPEDCAEVEEAFRRALEEGEPYDLEARLTTEAGEERWARTSGQPQIDGGEAPGGEVIRIRGAVQNITERKRREHQLVEARKEAEEAARLKSAMMANMSHEVRTPLTSITGFADLLKAEVEGEAASFAKRIRQSGERLMKTMDSVFELSRLEAGVSDIDREKVCLAEIAEETAERLRPEAEEKSVSLRVERPEDSIQGFWNEGALTQVTENLLENGIKFTPEGGGVWIRVQRSEDGAVLEVEDTGVGIDEGAQPKIFEAFQQESEGFDREYEGTGLGLSIAQRLTEALGGTISVESEKGDGSRFTVHLPPGEPDRESGGSASPAGTMEGRQAPRATGSARGGDPPQEAKTSPQPVAEGKASAGDFSGDGAVFHEMYEITADLEATFDEKTARLIELGTEYLGLPHGHLTRISEGTQEILMASGGHPLIQQGATCPLSGGYCRKTIEEESLLAIQNAPAEGWANDPAYKKLGLGAYIGGKVVAEGEVYGTFCFAATEPRGRPFNPQEKAFVELLARWTSYEMERRRAKGKLEQQNERLEQFSGALTHDLRNPLNVAQGRMTLALEAVRNLEEVEQNGGSEDAGDAQVADHLRSAGRALERMESLIEDMLALTWGDQELESEDTEEVSLADMVEGCWEQVETSKATLQVEEDLRLQAHEGRLQQLLENLFRNAIEHGGETVTVTVGPLSEEESLSDGEPRGFFVEDDGPGIPEEKRDKISERGYSSEEGTGLGLSIVEAIGEAHGWNVSVTEGREGGARFEIRGVLVPEG